MSTNTTRNEILIVKADEKAFVDDVINIHRLI